MRNLTKPILISALILLGLASLFYFFRPKTVRLETEGKIQSGEKYHVICTLTPKSVLPFHSSSYSVSGLELEMGGRSRAVPSKALEDVTEMNPGRVLQVFQEGPVIVITTQIEKPARAIQWRFLNGQFAQRRILQEGSVSIQNVEARLQASSIVENVSPDAPRRLQSPSLLSTPENGNPTPSKSNP